MDGNGDTAFGCSIQFGKNNSGNISNLRKLSCLCKCILTGCTVQHNQCLTVSFRIFPVDHTVDFSKLCHKILFIMKSSCRIAEQYICMTCFGCLDRIVYNGCRIRSFLSGNDLHSCTVCPFGQLFSGCRTERIGCRQNYFLSLVF